jgi:hypothetical protein
MGAPEAGLCCERAESLARSLNRFPSFYRVLLGQWRQSLSTGKLSATLQIAKRLYALAQDAQPQSEDSSLTLAQFGNHLRKLAASAIGCIGQAEILKNLK